jgi:hypothetical protein
MVGNNGFNVNWNGKAATAIDTLEEIHYHLKKFQLEITGFTSTGTATSGAEDMLPGRDCDDLRKFIKRGELNTA